MSPSSSCRLFASRFPLASHPRKKPAERQNKPPIKQSKKPMSDLGRVVNAVKFSESGFTRLTARASRDDEWYERELVTSERGKCR